MIGDAGRFRPLADALGGRTFRVYISGNCFSLLGMWVQRTAAGWLAWEWSGSSVWVGIIAFADLFPTILTGPIGGVLADRILPRRILLVTQSLLAFLAFLLFLGIATGVVGLWLLAALMTVQGLMIGINQPARLSLIPDLGPREQLPAMIAINSVVFNSSRFIGPPIAAGLIIMGDASLAFLVNAVSYLAFIAALLRLGHVGVARSDRHGTFFADLAEGILYVARHPLIGPILLLFIGVSILVRPIGELLPAFAGAVFAGGPGALGVLSSALGVGAVIGGLFSSTLSAERIREGTLLSLFVASTAAALFPLMPNLALATVMIFLCGASFVIVGVGAQTVMQLNVAHSVRGRVMSLFGLVGRGSPAIGAMLLGVLGEITGLPLATVLCCIVFMVGAALLMTLRPPRAPEDTAAARD